MADCDNPNEQIPVYTAPKICIPSFNLQDDTSCGKTDSDYAEKLAAEALEIAGVGIHIFKLLGVHEQGKMIDLTGSGIPISSGTDAGSNIASAFDLNIGTIWRSSLTGSDIVSKPAYLGYYFGTKKTLTGTERYGRPQFINQHITSIKIKQSINSNRRATRLRLDRADGSVSFSEVGFVGTGNGAVEKISQGYLPKPGTVIITATSSTAFTVSHTAIGNIGNAYVTQRFNHETISFNVVPGNIPFQFGDTFVIDCNLNWQRVDIKDVPDNDALNLISFKASAKAPYWRIVPVIFNGVSTNDPWEIDQLQLMDYEQTDINNIQDMFFLENRDRDYAPCSLMLRAQYTPFDSLGDLGKFGLSILDQYTFTVSFARMIDVLGRPIVIGDILELPSEMQWDHNMKPVKKFLEVMDAGWSSEGYTPGWRPILYRFQAVQMTPSQENRDIVGTADSYLFKTPDEKFFANAAKQLDTLNLESAFSIKAETKDEVPETGQDPMDIASANAILGPAKTPDNHDLYIEDGLPPDGLPYAEGYTLPHISSVTDGEYFRLNYPDDTGIPSRLYKFNGIKGRWLYVETDRRMEGSSFKKSVRKIFKNGGTSIKG